VRSSKCRRAEKKKGTCAIPDRDRPFQSAKAQLVARERGGESGGRSIINSGITGPNEQVTLCGVARAAERELRERGIWRGRAPLEEGGGKTQVC